MENHVIQELNKNCPGIVYNPDKKSLDITGRSIHEDPELYFLPLGEWIVSHFNVNDSLNVNIRLEYINSGSSKCLFDILKKLTGYRRAGKDVCMRWLFEEDDDAMQDLGEHYRDIAGIPLRIEMV